MIDKASIRTRTAEVARNAAMRGCDLDVSLLAEDLTSLAALESRIGSLRRERNTLPGNERGRELKGLIKEAEAQLSTLEGSVATRLLLLPNWLDSRVPIGGEEQNEIVRQWGVPRTIDAPRSHQEIGADLGILDFDGARRSSGSRFYALRGHGVKLRQAIAAMFTEAAEAVGFELVSTPELVAPETLVVSGYRPFNTKQEFQVSGLDRPLSLIGTSEQAILGMYRDRRIDSLPLLLLGESNCFRTEAGNYGRDTAGMIRVHQFYKLEMLGFVDPAESDHWHQVFLGLEEQILERLEIPYRTVLTASQDLGYPGMIKYDTEAWFPYQNTYREVTSNTNIGDFQTRRGNIRARLTGGRSGFPYTISATGVCDRLVAAVLENGQQSDGSVRVSDDLAARLRLPAGVLERRTA